MAMLQFCNHFHLHLVLLCRDSYQWLWCVGYDTAWFGNFRGTWRILSAYYGDRLPTTGLYTKTEAGEPYRTLKSMYQTTLCQIPEDALPLTIMITTDLTY